MKISLTLGCHGLEDEDHFIYCTGISNKILDISLLDDYSSERVLNFLDNAAGLFDSPCFDYNKCMNLITVLYRDYKVIPEKSLYKIQGFLKNHKQCGIFIMLIPEE